MAVNSRRRPSGRSGKRAASPSLTARRGWRSAQRTEYGGRVYASKSEACYAAHLDRLVRAGQIVGWDAQVRWPLIVEGVKVCVMVPDFRVWLSKKRYELHEVKGHPQPVWRLKHKLFSALHPDVVYRVIPAREALAL